MAVTAAIPASVTQGPSTAGSNPALRLWANGLAIDLEAQRVCELKIEIAYSHPARLSWTMHQPQQSLPLPHRAHVILTEETFGGQATPLFEGHIHDVSPGENPNEVRYVAFDPTRRAAQEVTIMNGLHSDPSVYPRAVWNVKIDNDDDYAFELAHDATTAEILQTLLGNALPELATMQAAPISGSAYVAGELEPFDFKSQEKVVFESETLRAGIDRLLGIYPAYRILFTPGEAERHWHFQNVKSAPQLTLTLNDHRPSNPHRVLSMKLQRSMEDRATAVKIYGPEKTQSGDVDVSAGTLTKQWNPAYEGGFASTGPGGSPLWADVSRRWQIADPAKRHLANLLPIAVTVDKFKASENATTILYLRTPALLATWDAGDTWEAIHNITVDKNQGIVTTPYHVYKYDESAPNKYQLPDNVRFVFAYYVPGLSVRYPASGYSGTAYTVAGAEIEMRRYDESLAAGFERYLIADQAERSAEFTKLAQSIHEAHRDIIYTGGCTLEGLVWDFARLNKRVNFAAVGSDGAPLATGWEAIDAILTDVEYDFTDRLTTLTFSSDHMEYTQVDPEELKRLLKLSALAAPRSPWVIIEYTDSAGHFNTRFAVTSLNEERYTGDR